MAEVYDRLGRLDRREELAKRASRPALPADLPEAPAEGDDDGLAEVLEAVGRIVRRWPGIAVMVAEDGRPGRPVYRLSERDGEVDAAVVGHQVAVPPVEQHQPAPAAAPAPPATPAGAPAAAPAAFGAAPAPLAATAGPVGAPAAAEPAEQPDRAPVRRPALAGRLQAARGPAPDPATGRPRVDLFRSGPGRPQADEPSEWSPAHHQAPDEPVERQPAPHGDSGAVPAAWRPEQPADTRAELRLVPDLPSGRHASRDDDEPETARGPAGRVALPEETSEVVARLAQLLRDDPTIAATWGREAQES